MEKDLFNSQHHEGEIEQNFNCEEKKEEPSRDFFGKYNPSEKMAFIREMAILKFGSINRFSKAMGVSRSMGSMLLSGQYIPLKITSLQRIADTIGINVILLTKIYEGLKNEQP